MTNLIFFTLVIFSNFELANQTLQIPNFGHTAVREGLKRRRKPRLEEILNRRNPFFDENSARENLFGRKALENFARENLKRRKLPPSVRERLKKSTRKKLEKNENDVLSFDYIEDEADKSVQTVEIPEEVLALDEEKSAKPKPEGRKKRGRVVGGTDVLSEEEFPFYASLRNSAQPNCGATILGNSTYALSF